MLSTIKHLKKEHYQLTSAKCVTMADDWEFIVNLDKWALDLKLNKDKRAKKALSKYFLFGAKAIFFKMFSAKFHVQYFLG